MPPESRSLLHRGEWHADARALKAANPDMSYAEIGRRLGVTQSAAWKALNPARAKEYAARDNAIPERHEAKKAWERENHRRPCPTCSGEKDRHSEACQGCMDATAAVRGSLTEGMWADGWSAREIADVFGHASAGFVGAMRARGWDLPPRRTPEQIARMHAARWGSGPSPFHQAVAA